MRKSRIVCFLLIVCLHITFFAFPISTKGKESFQTYTNEQIGQSVGYIALLDKDKIKHVSTSYIIYQKNGYSYIATSSIAAKTGYDKKAYFGNNILDIELVGKEDSIDLAIFKFETKKYPVLPLKFASSNNLYVGERISFHGVVGFSSSSEPFFSYEKGFISKKDVLYCPSGKYLLDCSALMLLDMNLDSTSQGGPILNEYGYVVGMVTMNNPVSKEEGAEKLFHATFSNDLNLFLNRILQKNNNRADLGIYIKQIEELSVLEKETMKLTSYKTGTIVTAVKNSASMSGLSVNYVITKINGVNVPTTIDLLREMYKYEDGTVIRVQARKTDGNLKTYYIKA